MRRKRREPEPQAKRVRCARKSTEEGLQQEFNSLGAQRESARSLHRTPYAPVLGEPSRPTAR